MRLPIIATSLAILLSATAAHADPGFGIRARPAGLDFIGDTVRDLVPTHFDIPNVEASIITVTNASADLNVKKVELKALDGALEVDLSIDVDAHADLDAGFTDCQVDLSIVPANATIKLFISTDAQGNIQAQAVELNVGLSADQFELDIEGCFLGDLVENIFQAVEEWALEKITGLIEDQASEKILPLIQEQIAKLLELELETQGFRIAGNISSLSLAASNGLTALIDGDITWTGPTSPDVTDNGPPATERPVGQPLPPSYGPAQFALAAGDDRVTHAIYQAWRGGMFSDLLKGLAPSIELSEEGLAQKLGLPGGTTIDLSIDVAKPPLARFGRNGVGSVRLELSDLGVTATITVPGAAPAVLQVTVDGVAAASVGLDPARGALQLNLDDLTIERLDVVGGAAQIQVDPVRLHEFIRAVVTPMLAATVSGIEIAPALQASEGFFTIARSVTTEGGWLRVAADMHRPDPNDETAPNTSLVDPPKLVSPAMTRFPVTGTDNSTPAELLRYRIRLDGTEVGDKPDFMSAVKVSAEHGNHQLEVWAVDLNGNEDRTPVVHSFYVDGLPPELALHEAPAQVSGSAPGRVTWSASDDRTSDDALQTKWTLRTMVGGSSEVVASAEFAAGLRHVDLPALDSDTLYILEVVARDEAGNVTSVEHGFAVEPGGSSGGCSAVGSTGSTTLILLGLAFLLVVRRRRRSAVGMLVAGLMAATVPAQAQGVGTTLSGPTDADGAASFWNPAAMFRGAGTQVDAGSAVSFIRASYQPMDTTTSSHTFVPKPEPTLGAYSDLGGQHRLRVGFTVAVPQIDGASWARDDAASDVTRWFTVKAKTYHVTVTPSMAYQPTHWLSLGAGINVVRSRIEAELDKDMGKSFNQAAGSPAIDSPFPYGDPTFAAPVTLQATGWSVGAVAGLMLRPHRRVTFGASIHTPATSKGRGDINVTYPESVANFVNGAVPAADLPPLEGDMTVDLKMPLMTFAALAVEPVDRWEVRADYRFVNRSAASDLYFDVDEATATSEDVKDSAVIRGYNDRHSFGLRVSHMLKRGLVALRARYEPNSIPDSTIAPNNLDFDKYEVGAAARLDISRRVSLVAHYSHFFIASRTVESSLHQPYTESTLEPFNHPSPTGTYGASSDYVAMVLSVSM